MPMFAPPQSSHTPEGSPDDSRAPLAAMRPIAPEIDSLQLLRGQREVRIRHGDEWYRLRHTRNDKLILTK
jgi:hemin uptake protein HemP